MTTTGTAASDGRPRNRLDRETIVRGALSFIDEEGPAGLTMRKLGNQLGVEAMSLYRYVTGREDLLEAVVAHLTRGLEEHLDDDLTGTWQGYLKTLAYRVREIATEHPNAFPLVATRHPAAPWLRPPLRSLTLVEQFLATLSGHGFDDVRVVAIYRAFSNFLLGHLLLQAATQGAKTAPVELPLNEGEADVPAPDAMAIDLTDVPTVARMRRLLSEDHSTQEFEAGLETLLHRLELTLVR